MPALKPGTIRPTPAEDTIIRAAIASDHDTREITEADVPFMQLVSLDKPIVENSMEKITIDLSPDIVNAFKSTGQGWQTRIDAALRQFLSEHPI